MVPILGGLPSGSLQNPAWSPDGTKLAFTRFRNGYNKAPADIFVTEVATSALSTVSDDGSENVNAPGSTWHPSGGLVFSSDRNGHDEIYAWKDGQLTQLTSRAGFVAWEPSWSPSGQAVVFESHPDQAGETPGQIISHQIGTDQYVPITQASRDCRQPNWSPDGRLIVYQEQLAAERWQLELYDVVSGASRALVAGTDATFSPDSSRVVYSDSDGRLATIPIGGGLAQRLGGSGYQGAPSWSPDGRTIAYETSANDPDGSTVGTTLALIGVSGAVPLPQAQVASVPISGKPLRYLIGADAAPAIAGCCVEAPYGVAPPPGGIWYLNLYDQESAGGYAPYLADTDVSRQYGERVVDPAGAGWAKLINAQLARVPVGGTVEWDNIDGYPIAAVLDCYARTAAYGIAIIAKNPGNLTNGDKLKVVAHPAVIGIIVEQGAGSPDEMQALRMEAGKPALPVRFVAFGAGMAWAVAMRNSIVAKSYSEMGVTFDAKGEYGGDIEDVLVPLAASAAPVAAMVSGADIIAKARSYIGQFSDGPDVPRLAQAIGATFPDLAAYCREAGSGTPWCGIFVAYVMAQFGIRPPHADDSVGGFMYVDAWKNWGDAVDPANAQPGDVAIFLGSPHHVSIVAGNGKYCGGNQGAGVVSEERIRTPNYVRRFSGTTASVSTAMPAIAKPAGQFEKCVAYVLVDEGGNDDDPRDPGGRTSRGITEAEWQIWTSTHPGLPSDVWQAPQADVLAIYRQNYWDVVLGDQLPTGVDHAVFDYGVNSGNSRAAKALQAIVGTDADGEIGPLTIAATRSKDPAQIINALCDQRMAFLRGLSTWGTFGRGWTNRVNGVRAHALAMVGTVSPQPVVQPIHTDPLPADSTLAGVLAAFAAVNARLDQMDAAIQALRESIMPTATPPTVQPSTSSTAPPLDLSQVLGHLTQLTQVLQQIMPGITQILGTIQKNPLPALPGLAAAIPGIAGHVGGAVVPATLTGLLGGAFKLLGSSGGIGSIVALGIGLMLAMQQGVIGTPLPTASGGTAAGQGLSTLLGGGGLLSLISWVGQLIKPHPASPTQS